MGLPNILDYTRFTNYTTDNGDGSWTIGAITQSASTHTDRLKNTFEIPYVYEEATSIRIMFWIRLNEEQESQYATIRPFVYRKIGDSGAWPTITVVRLDDLTVGEWTFIDATLNMPACTMYSFGLGVYGETVSSFDIKDPVLRGGGALDD